MKTIVGQIPIRFHTAVDTFRSVGQWALRLLKMVCVLSRFPTMSEDKKNAQVNRGALDFFSKCLSSLL